MGTFQYKGKSFTIVSFHAVPKKKNPASEIKYFKFFPIKYPKLNFVFMGDFTCRQSHSVFFPIKKNGFSNSMPMDPITNIYHNNPSGSRYQY